ncbi:hypothetical protein [Chryseobacterium sp.]|uniref:hypothetical protein n=1 Tax=Chryseobacterium sp. TaxID=1871047 RepID=UPI0035B21F47
MKKTIFSLAILVAGIGQLYAQQQQVNFGDFSRPVPSVSSLATYSNTPVSNATGLPDISLPLLGLPTHNKAVSLNFSLSYNPLNIAATEPASEVGTGWSLFAGGVISRSIVNEFDEKFDDTSTGNYIKNNFDDVYYYNLPGISGKFKIIRNITANTFELINLSSNRIKIEYTRDSNTATLIFNSFTITDTKGIKYIFNDYSRSNQQQDLYGISNKIYKSAFFLSQIKDANNVELANFTYQKDIKYKPDGTTLLYQTCKLKTITSADIGKIEINYTYDASLEQTLNDPYSINSIVLKTKYDAMVSGYSFEYSTYPFVYFNGSTSENINKRTLTKLKKLNKNNVISETTEFRYANPDPNLPDINTGYNGTFLCHDPDLTNNPHRAVLGSLKKIINPTGGVTEYNFEPNEIYVDKSNADYLSPILNGENFVDPELQYPEIFKEINFNTNQSNNYSFTVSGTAGKAKKVYILYHLEEKFPPPIYWDDSPTYVAWNIANPGNNYYDGGYCSAVGYNEDYYVKAFNLMPGIYTIQFTGSGGRGSIQFYDLKHKPQPFTNKSYINSLRIGNIKYYNSINETTPVKITNFKYDSFTDSRSSSGYTFYPEVEGHEEGQSYVLYRNVKVSNTDDGNGYIKYYYKTPNDYPAEPYIVNGITASYQPYYGMVKGGVLEKEEVYNAQNSLLTGEQFDYTFEAIPDAHDYQLFGNGASVYSKAAWLKRSSVTSTSYFGNNQSIEEQSETNFNVFNFDVSSTKKVVDGNTIEQFYTYPEAGFANLAAAHILNVPVIIEEKTDGQLVSRTETKFTNPASTRPIAVMTSNIGNTVQKTATIDLYDEKGNAIQFTSPAGISTTVIYGYDKTQPIAKIEGATYAQVSPYVQAITDASNADAQNPANEPALLTALDNFRKLSALQNFQVTTYTYDPLIGMTTTTPPNGIRAIYKYDDQNRLQKITDMNGVTLKEYQYNYKN